MSPWWEAEGSMHSGESSSKPWKVLVKDILSWRVSKSKWNNFLETNKCLVGHKAYKENKKGIVCGRCLGGRTKRKSSPFMSRRGKR